MEYAIGEFLFEHKIEKDYNSTINSVKIQIYKLETNKLLNDIDHEINYTDW